MIKKWHQTSVHHLLPRSMWGNNEGQNLIEIKDNLHRSFHHLFANQLIAKQLLTTLDLSAKALRPDVVEWLVETLNTRDIDNIYDRYDEDVIR